MMVVFESMSAQAGSRALKSRRSRVTGRQHNLGLAGIQSLLAGFSVIMGPQAGMLLDNGPARDGERSGIDARMPVI